MLLVPADPDSENSFHLIANYRGMYGNVAKYQFFTTRVWRYGLSIVDSPGPGDNRQLTILRRACELQLYGLFFALPFEYYFGSREQTLFTSLKLQILLFTATWALMKFAAALKSVPVTRPRLRLSLPGRLLVAIALFVLTQSLAAVFASDFGGNAAKAAVKTGFGALLAIAAADLAAGFNLADLEKRNPVRASMLALSGSGSMMAVLGLGELAGMDVFSSVVHLFQKSKFFLGDRVRFVSTMEHPNTAGAFLSAALCASLALAVSPNSEKPRHRRLVWSTLAAIQGFALVLTLSRGAIASTILGILAVSWFFHRLAGETQKRTVIVACCVALLIGMPGLYLARRGIERSGVTVERRIALWGLKATEEIRPLFPGRIYDERIGVQNTSPVAWPAGICGVGYKWHSLGTGQTEPLVAGPAFRDAIEPDQRAEIPVSLSTPPGAGEYLLIWFIVCRDKETTELKDSYSPGILCLVDPAGSASPKVISDKARRYVAAIRDERRRLDLTVTPGRWDLWRAALRMVSQSPLLGKGPDSFRVLKSRYMDFPTWDETILANNLYLEILSGSGILGLGSFLWVLWEFASTLVSKAAHAHSPWDRSSAYFGAMYLSTFMLHGVVDYFLKFTPTFLLFWLLLGMLCAGGREYRGTYANRL